MIMAKEKPNLEEIAQRLSSMDEDLKIGEIDPRVSDAYLSIAKYKDKKGVIRYKHDFSDEPDKVKELSDTIFDAISDHIHHLEYNMDPSQYNNLKNIKNASGNAYTDTHAQLALGMSREDLRKVLDKQKDNINLTSILKLVQDAMGKNYIAQKTKQILEPIDETYTEDIKKYIIEKANKHNLPKKLYHDKVKGKKLLEEVLPLYTQLASQIYKK